jgi:hypothetical protein
LFLIYGGINESNKELFKIENENPGVKNLLTFIKENSRETDKITVAGNDCWIYILSGRESISKYAYQFPIITVNGYGPEIAEKYINDIANGKPRIIIIRSYMENLKFIKPTQLSALYDFMEDTYEAIEDTFAITNLSGVYYYHCWVRKQLY